MIPELNTLGLPAKFTEWRAGQKTIVETAIEQPRVLAEAPPGVGKTIIAAALQRLSNQQAVYVTPNKSLQIQVCSEIPHARMVMGRANYECLRYPGETAEVCDHTKEDPCESILECPYCIARDEAKKAPLAVLNSSYYLYASNYAQSFRRHQLIIDEADEFDNAVLSFIQVDLPRKTIKMLESYHLPAPQIDDVQTWIAWAKKVLDENESIKNSLLSVSLQATWSRLVAKLQYLVSHGNETWFMEDTPNEGKVFRPVTAAPYMESLVWKNHAKILGMSGTLIGGLASAYDLGLREATSISVACPFPAENRPIYDCSQWIGVLNRDNLETMMPNILTIMSQIIDEHPNSKILVPTPSYDLALRIEHGLNSPRVIRNENATDRQLKLDFFRQSSEPLILISPSFDRGLDLYEDVYNCVIVPKAPFASLGSKAVSLRRDMSDGAAWYSRKAAATLVQMCCRGVRSSTKKCDIFLLDAACRRLLKMCPDWFQEAVIIPESE